MGKIDKEKLLKEIPCTNTGLCANGKCKHNDKYLQLTVSKCIGEIIKNFPEEPEQPIDFDALYSEFFNNECDGVVCSTCKYYGNDSSDGCFAKFLKSKNLTAPKPFEVPVKKTWTLKKEYQEFCENNNIKTELVDNKTTEPEFQHYYDLHEEPDYSKIPNGSIVEVKNGLGTHYRKFSHFDSNYIWLYMPDGQIVDWPKSKFVRVVELAKE